MDPIQIVFDLEAVNLNPRDQVRLFDFLKSIEVEWTPPELVVLNMRTVEPIFNEVETFHLKLYLDLALAHAKVYGIIDGPWDYCRTAGKTIFYRQAIKYWYRNFFPDPDISPNQFEINRWKIASRNFVEFCYSAYDWWEVVGPCTVCLEEIQFAKKIKLDCSHTFHVECFQQCIGYSNHCPNCRGVVFR